MKKINADLEPFTKVDSYFADVKSTQRMTLLVKSFQSRFPPWEIRKMKRSKLDPPRKMKFVP